MKFKDAPDGCWYYRIYGDRPTKKFKKVGSYWAYDIDGECPPFGVEDPEAEIVVVKEAQSASEK